MSATNIVKISEEINGFHVYVPENLDVEATLPVENRNWSDQVRYVVSLINQRLVFERLHQDDHVPLKADLLRRVLPWRDYKKILDLMVQCKIIDRDDSYQVGKFSKSFRLTEEYRGQVHRRHLITDADLCKKRQRLKRVLERGMVLPAHKHLWHWLQEITFSFPGDLSSYRNYSSQLEQLQCKDFFLKVCKYGRVHTNVTNLKTECRNYLSYQGEELSNVDIANSQPLFLGILLTNFFVQGESATLKSVYSFNTIDLCEFYPELISSVIKLEQKPHPNPSPLCCCAEQLEEGLEETTPETALSSGESVIPKDLQRYLHVCSRGRLYEELMRLTGTTERAKVKEEFFTYLFARSSLEKHLPIAQVIEAEFPSVARAVRTLKEKDHTAVAKMLQRTESDFIVNRVVRRMMTESPQTFVLTIHDSVVTPTADVETVKKVMYREFRMLGLRPRLKTERLVPPSQALAG